MRFSDTERKALRVLADGAYLAVAERTGKERGRAVLGG
jgi:hypothetical protein